MSKHSPITTTKAKSVGLREPSSLIERKDILRSRVSQSLIVKTDSLQVAERETGYALSAMPGHELIDKIDTLAFTQQDIDEMMSAVQEGRKIEYERWSRKLFD